MHGQPLYHNRTRTAVLIICAHLACSSCLLTRVPLHFVVAAANHNSKYRLPWMEGEFSEVPGADMSMDPVGNPAAVQTLANVYGYNYEKHGAEEMKYSLMQLAVLAIVVRTTTVGNSGTNARHPAMHHVPTCSQLRRSPRAAQGEEGPSHQDYSYSLPPPPRESRFKTTCWEDPEPRGQLRHRYQVSC